MLNNTKLNMKNNRTTTASTNVEYVVTASYEWSVPSKITFTDTIAEVEANADTGDTQKVKVTKNIMPVLMDCRWSLNSKRIL